MVGGTPREGRPERSLRLASDAAARPAPRETAAVDDSMLDQLLAELAPLFCDEDDNPLPEMGICGVPPGAANAIWQRLLLDARIVPVDRDRVSDRRRTRRGVSLAAAGADRDARPLS